MRKLRTLLFALVLTLVSVFVSACSCGGTGEGGGLNINHIYAESIKLSCLTNNGSVVGEIDPVSQDLYITCHVGDRFVIEYEITPSNATTTQVNWSFDNAGVGIVEPYKSEGYTRNKSTKEQVEFEAKARSDSKYKTTLTFTIQDLNKSAKAYIEVYDAVEDLSSFVVPENVNFDTKTNSLTWSAVNKVKEPDGDVVNAKVSAGYPVGLTGYEIIKVDPVTDEQVGEPIAVGKGVTKYSGLEAGVDYAFKVRALADGLNVKTGEFSNTFKFYKLETISELTNQQDNKFGGSGSISFKAPLRSSKSTFYYFGLENASSYTPYEMSTASSLTDKISYTLSHNYFVDKSNSDKYNIEVVSYPENFNSTKGYADIDGVRYYPSDASTPYAIQKLVKPNIELATNSGTIRIDGVDFANSNLSTYVSLGVDQEYPSSYEQGYYYKLFVEGSLQEPIKEGYVSDGKISLEGRNSLSYVLEVTTTGNANTINSTTETFRFNVLEPLTDENITLQDDIVHHDTRFTTGGIELFFVSKDATKKQEYSVRSVIDVDNTADFNIQELGLNAGDYDVYAKSMSYIYEEYQNASVLPSTFEKIFSIEVAPQVTSNMITKEGVILFKKLDRFDNYQIIVNRKLSTDVEYREEQVVNIYAPTAENIGNGLLTYEVSYTDENKTATFDSDGHNARISIEKVVSAYLNDVYTDLDLTGFFSSNHLFIYSIVTIGDDIEDKNVISSSATTTFEIQRYAPVPTIKLNNYKLVYDKVGKSDRQQYTVYLYTYDKDSGTLKNSYEFKSFVGLIIGDNEVEVDLKTLTVKDGTAKFVDLIDITATNKVAVCALGSDGKVNSPAILNSLPTEQTFDFATTPFGLTMDESGNVTWKSEVSVDELNQYNYTAQFYLATKTGTDVEYALLNNHTLKNLPPVFDEVEGERVAILKVYVGDILANYEDQVIAITITENKFDMFSGLESKYLYASRISSPVLTRKTTEGKDTIAWTAINNADVYDISVTDLSDSAIIGTYDGSGNTFFSITDRLTDSENPWVEGMYEISVSARSNAITNPDDNAFDTPYVLTSVPSSTVVNIVNARLEVAVNGTTLTWANVCGENSDAKAQYSLYYELADGTTNTVDMGSLQTYDAQGFKAGTNYVTITPTISFEETAFIIVGTPHKNAIDKWNVATGLDSEDGNLILYVVGATNALTPVIELYQTISETDTVVSTGSYYYDAPEETTINVSGTDTPALKYTIILDGMDAGKLVFKVKVKSEGLIDSDLSESYEGTKIAAVTDLAKVGDYLTWTAQPGISSYSLGYLNAGNLNFNFLDLKVEEDATAGYIAYVTSKNADGDEQQETNEDIFKYDKTTNKFSYLFDEELFVGTQSGDVLFNIRPLTSVEGYFSGNTSSFITITKLNANVTITVADGILVIDKYLADGSAIPTTYKLSIYKFTTNEESGEIERDLSATYTTSGAYVADTGIASVDLNTVGLEENGNYEVELQFFGNENEVLDSEVIKDVTFDKLETTALRTQDGVLSWSPVDGAENYTILISDGTNEYEFVVTGEMLREEDLVPPATEPEPEPEPENPEVPEEPEIGGDEYVEPTSLAINNTPFSFLPGIWYTVKIKANATSKIHSKWSLPFSVKKLYAPTDLDTTASVGSFDIQVEVVSETDEGTLTTTETRTVAVGTPIITWKDKNSSDLRFDYYLQYSEQYHFEVPYNTSLAYTLETDLPIERYGIQMKVYGNTSAGSSSSGYLTSDFSMVYYLNYIDDVITPRVSNGIVSWDKVDSAFAYKVTAYKTNEYKTYLETEGAELPVAVFTTVTASDNINFANIILAENVTTSGSYTFVINALTRPEDSIVTSYGEKQNTVNVFKPSVFVDYKVKDGRLYWKIPVADVIEFVTSQTTAEGTSLGIVAEDIDLTNADKVAQAVIAYALRRVNMGVGDNEVLEEQIKHLISIRLQVNGVTFTDTPSEAKIIDASGNEIVVESGYTSAEYIEYYYDVEIEPEINDDTTEEEPTDPEEPLPEEPIDSEESASEGGEEIINPSSIRSNNTAGVEYVAGRYTIKVSAVGNSNETAPVVNGAYTTTITAYKPNTPRTWTTDGADIYFGKVQWELSTTEKSTIDDFDYYENYRIRALGVSDASAKTTIKVSVSDTYDSVSGTNPNLTNEYLYYRDLKEEGTNEGLFTIVGSQSNKILKDTFYRLFISTEGTADSTELADGETIYLNSNECVVNRPVNILSQTKEVRVDYGNLTWQTSFGSTATKLFIYGPFDCWDATGTKINSSWRSQKTSEIILSQIEAVHNGNYDGLTEEEINNYKNMLHIVTLGEVEGIRTTNYSLTDQIDPSTGESMYAPGGYIIKTQELGDDKGVVDSEISSGLAAIKLGVAAVKDNAEDNTDIMQTAGWVGLTDSKVYKWNNSISGYEEKTYAPNAPNEKVGVFVWNPVAGANTYEVQVYYVAPDAEYGEWVYSERIRETSYSLPEIEQCKNEGYYFLRIFAMHTSMRDSQEMTPNYFTADYVDTTKHERVRVPEALTIFGSGEIQWNYGYTYNDIGSYRVQFNYGSDGLATEIIAETGTDSVVPALNLGAGDQNGTVEISIKAVAVSGNGMLNSEYCTSVKVTRLADPDMRLVNGVLYWGNVNGSDPITATEFTTDGGEVEIIDKVDGESTYATYLKYFTDITEYDDTYRAVYDEMKFKTGEHTFTTMFQGTGGNEGTTMDGSGDFYISSNTISLTATKLDAPVIDNVTHSFDSGSSENMVQWQLDENAKGYRIRVFSNVEHPKGYPYYEKNVSMEELQTLLTAGTTDNANFFVDEVDEDIVVYFKLSPVISEYELASRNGGDIYIFVQALGSGLNIDEETATEDLSERPADGDLFLSSSYSTPTSVGVPPNPKITGFNENTGLLEWTINSETPYNIKVESNYKVTGVTEEELNYWKDSANKFYFRDGSLYGEEQKYTAYPEIVNRIVNIETEGADPNDQTKTLYALKVYDTIVLTERENGGRTPLSYQVRSTGVEYSLSVTAMSFVDGDPTFASDMVSLSGSARRFQTFDGGDGHVNNPYKISGLAQLQAIKDFTSSAFVITQNIDFVDAQNNQTYWRAIPTFNGVIDGGNNVIDNFAIIATVGENGITDIMSLFETNNGTIKNLTINISDKKIAYNGTTDGVNVATVAITNNGTIDNVHITGTIEILPTGESGYNITTLAGGLVVTNSKNATITNSSATEMNISALDDMEDFVSVGGIATNNNGTITNTYFDGFLLSNRLGGITAKNTGLIDRCYVTEDSIINVTNRSSSSNTLKGAVVGGIAAAHNYDSIIGLEKARITNSYSLATIRVTKGGDANQVGYIVGGLVGTMTANINVEVANSYVVVKIVKDVISGTTINVYEMLSDANNVVMTNNYYIVETCELTVSSSSLNEAGVCEKLVDATALKTKLATLKDDDNNQVYVVTDTEYPTLYRP